MIEDRDPTLAQLLTSLQERSKELDCLYRIEELFTEQGHSRQDVCRGVAEALVAGMQYPSICQAEVACDGVVHRTENGPRTPCHLRAEILVQEQMSGEVCVYYTGPCPDVGDGPFLLEERRLLKSVADRLAHYVLFERLRDLRKERAHFREDGIDEPLWLMPIQMLRESDPRLHQIIARKLLNLLCSMGVDEAQDMLGRVDPAVSAETVSGEVNVPGVVQKRDESVLLSDAPFFLAARHMTDHQILLKVQRWIQDDRASLFLKILDNPRTTLPELADALRRYHHLVGEGSSLQPSTVINMRVSLVRRFLTEQLDYIRVAKEYVTVADLRDLIDRLIMPVDGTGKLGGKGSGLILADRILARASTPERPVGEVHVPRTWYLASDATLEFIAHNDLEDVIEQKYKEIGQVRQEYPNIIQLFKHSPLPPHLRQGLAAALDELGEVPLIVRSSSLLEDRFGTSFSGKYKSLFLPNQGERGVRLEALCDAITEIYASVFGPDPVEYRRDRGLLDFSEEMGILIQEVVGRKVGRYFLPAFAGVAFSRNEFRWSPRIRRDDGLIRLVPGLGTRAVDRVGDDFPVLAVPGQPNLRVNVEVEEIVRYAPNQIDVIDLERNAFVTMSIPDLLHEVGGRYPGLELVFSKLSEGMLQQPRRLMYDPAHDELVATFDGLINGTPFVRHLRNVLVILEEKLGTPVDIEFAHDGEKFYLLQCRPQSHTDDAAPAPIPKDVAVKDILFTADRHVSNGWLPDATHVVYVDPDAYAALEDRASMLAVGRAVGELNKLLPRRGFILMGPGRWGSRGDIKLGVSVTYADISNTSMLVEIARLKGGYLPDLSFGTHFFQDLVESRIRYLPLYPDRDGIVFNEQFLLGARNLLPELLPQYAAIAGTLRVIDVQAEAAGRVLRVLMNADLDEALACFVEPGLERGTGADAAAELIGKPGEVWRWRLQMAERIARDLDAARFGVKAMYVFGSVKNATAGPGSDIDLLVHMVDDPARQADLRIWLDGWSRCLSEINYLRTGYRSAGLLDVHLITDRDVAERSSYAVKIGAITDPARELRIGGDDAPA
jgi:hypothetical protein